MTTERQIAANQQNARKCTGPRSVEGKASVSQNARKHGLCAQDVVLDDPDEIALFYDLRQSFSQFFNLSGDPSVDLTINMALAANFSHNFIIRAQQGAKTHLLKRTSDNLVGADPLPEDPVRRRDMENHLLGISTMGDLRQDDTLSKYARYQAEQARLFQRCVRDLRENREAQLAQGLQPAAEPVEESPTPRPVLVRITRDGEDQSELPTIEAQPERSNETKPISDNPVENQHPGIVKPCPVCTQHPELHPRLVAREPLALISRDSGVSVADLWYCRLLHCEDLAQFYDIDVASLQRARLFDAPNHQPQVRVIQNEDERPLTNARTR